MQRITRLQSSSHDRRLPTKATVCDGTIATECPCTPTPHRPISWKPYWPCCVLWPSCWSGSAFKNIAACALMPSISHINHIKFQYGQTLAAMVLTRLCLLATLCFACSAQRKHLLQCGQSTLGFQFLKCCQCGTCLGMRRCAFRDCHQVF